VGHTVPHAQSQFKTIGGPDFSTLRTAPVPAGARVRLGRW
jgi:hypothetical protein